MNTKTLGRIGACAAVLTMCGSGAANAAVVSSDGNTISFNGAPGERSDLSVSYETGDSGPTIWFYDYQGGLSTNTPDQCTRDPDGSSYVECRRAPNVVVNLGDGDDRARGSEGGDLINGGDGNDNLEGGAGNDRLDGGPGDDGLETTGSVVGNPEQRLGADTLAGGPGTDIVSYHTEQSPINASLDGAANDGRAGEGDNVTGDVEGIRGGSGNDVISGDAGANQLYGDAGDDELRGGAGNDKVEGGSDQDRSYGDAGDDEVLSGHGDDFLDGGTGADRMDGDAGDGACGYLDCTDRAADTIQARDGTRDLVGCGIHFDNVTADQADDVAATCENVDRGRIAPPRGDETAPGFTAGASKKLKLRKVLRKGMPITINVDEAASFKAVATVRGAGKVATGSTAVARAGKVKLVLKFTKKARKKLAAKRRVKLNIRITAVDGAGNTSAAQGRVTLKR